MRFALLGSGSEGNALLVESAEVRLLVDCGFGLAETETRLARLGVALEQLDAILVTHEHGDHAGGVARVAAKARAPVYLTHGTHASLPSALAAAQIRIIDSHTPFALRDVLIKPYPVPHDAREPVQFVFESGGARLALLTDVGGLTPHIEHMLSGCNAVVLECNHDAQMLRDGPYPASLKARVAGRTGHLDNAAAAALLQRIDSSRLSCLVAAHLSVTNNRPALAQQALANVLNCVPDWIAVADQALGLGWRDVALTN
jgi:phosphoribosyl 1,2-cyclic phosphodiesterase